LSDFGIGTLTAVAAAFEASGVARSNHLPVVRQTHRRCE
jgi:hypothetical protein